MKILATKEISESLLKVQASACAENRATTRKSTGKIDPSGIFLVDLLLCQPIYLYAPYYICRPSSAQKESFYALFDWWLARVLCAIYV